MNTSDPRFVECMDRRTLLMTCLGTFMTASPSSSATTTKPPTTQGKPGDFNFLSGEWRIHNRMLENDRWIEFDGEATVFSLLADTVSIEELRIPSRNFYGMGLRLLDQERKIWSDHWVNAKSGVLTVPGQEGVFIDGEGSFTSEDTVEGVRWIYRGVWDRITPTTCRWQQSSSNDGGKTWSWRWTMHWTRVDASKR